MRRLLLRCTESTTHLEPGTEQNSGCSTSFRCITAAYKAVQGEQSSVLPAQRTRSQVCLRVVTKLKKNPSAALKSSLLPEERHQSSKLKHHETFVHTVCRSTTQLVRQISLCARSACVLAAAPALNQLQECSDHALANNGDA